MKRYPIAVVRSSQRGPGRGGQPSPPESRRSVPKRKPRGGMDGLVFEQECPRRRAAASTSAPDSHALRTRTNQIEPARCTDHRHPSPHGLVQRIVQNGTPARERLVHWTRRVDMAGGHGATAGSRKELKKTRVWCRNAGLAILDGVTGYLRCRSPDIERSARVRLAVSELHDSAAPDSSDPPRAVAA